jgi:hypothetical protein
VQERQAIDRAFNRLLGEEALPVAYRSRWFAAALRENMAERDPAPEFGYAGRPRRTRSATRA